MKPTETTRAAAELERRRRAADDATMVVIRWDADNEITSEVRPLPDNGSVQPGSISVNWDSTPE